MQAAPGEDPVESLEELAERLAPVRAVIDAAMENLPQRHCDVVRAVLWGGLSYRAVADALGISLTSVHRYFHAGISELKEALYNDPTLSEYLAGRR